VSWHRLQRNNLFFADGTWKAAYSWMVSFENLDTGKVRMLHESGTVSVSVVSSDVYDVIAASTTGRELSAFYPGDLGPGSPGQYMWITGSSTEIDLVGGPNANPMGINTLSFKAKGQTENLCQTMA
jgi:hypothetical protein